MSNLIQFEGTKKENSRFGIVSFIISLSAMMLIILSLIPSYLSMDYEDYIGWGFVVAILLYIGIPTGFGFSIASFVKKEPKKVYAKIGLFINLAFILYFIVTFIIALLETPDIRKW